MLILTMRTATANMNIAIFLKAIVMKFCGIHSIILLWNVLLNKKIYPIE